MRSRRPGFSLLVAGLVTAAALLAVPPLAAASPPDPHPPVGHITENATSGVIEGVFVTLVAPSDTRVVENYTSEGIRFFDSVAVPGYVLLDKTFLNAVVKIDGTGASLQVHDNPNSVLKVALDNGSTATFALADGISAAAGPNFTVALSIDGSNRTASIWSACGNASISISAAGDSVEVVAPMNCNVFFRSHVDDPSPESRFNNAVENGHLAAEIYASAGDVTTFGDVVVIVSHAPPRTVVSLESQSNAPASVLIRFDAAPGKQTPVVLVDGVPAQVAGSLEDALDATDDGGQVEVSIETQGNTGYLVVSLPSPTSHVIEIQDAFTVVQPPAEPTGLAIAAGAAVTALAAVVLFRRR
jgi:opacity protein-like surface antigen